MSSPIENAMATREDEPSTAGWADESFIRAALDQADLNALRIVLCHLTGDPELLGMRVEKSSFWGGSFSGSALAPEHADRVKEKALALLRNGPATIPAVPADSEIRNLMDAFAGRPMTDFEFRFGLEEMAFAEFPRGVEWTKKPAAATREGFHVVIIGAGLGGIAAAIQLDRLGIPYTIIERQEGVGGTWWVNDYPEARVDVVSHTYQYSFEKNYHWEHHFATQDELKRYVDHCARKFGVFSRIRFETEVTAASWDDASSTWKLGLRGADGTTTPLAANVIISAAGLFNAVNMPDIAGIETYQGKMFHTTAWDHSYDFRGKRIGLIGNGSSGSQLMPRLAEDAERFTVFQRTPGWISPIPGYRDRVSPEVQWLFDHVPYYWNWFRFSIFYMMYSDPLDLQNYDPEWQKSGGIISKRNDDLRKFLLDYIESKVGHDPELVRKCTPSFPPWAKRPIVDNGWYDALNRSNVDLVTEGIERITPKGVLTKDGVERPLDLIVLAAGFSVSRYLWPVRYEGRGGLTLEKAWAKDGARAYLGMTMPGFPNLFMIYGPNGQGRAGGLITWLEMWARYAVKSVVYMIENDKKSMECRPEVFADYNDRMDVEMAQCIWAIDGQSSYYVNEFGRSGVNMPWTTNQYYEWALAPTPSDYIIK